jgi:antitoxin VapB
MKTARLFRNGQSQAVRLPKEYRFSGDRVLIKKVGDAVVLLPEKGSWAPLIDSLSWFSEDFMESREQPGQQSRKRLLE